MTDPFTAPGLGPGVTPGHLGAPAEEPDGRPPGQPYAVEPPDPEKVRSGAACCLSVLALFGVACVLALAAYLVWPKAEPPAADFAGGGSGSVEVSVPQGASLTTIGRALVKSGVVASTKAFTDAAARHPAGNTIQPGTYTLKLKMSVASALGVLLDPANANALTIPEGRRAEQVYSAIDERLHLAPGTTKGIARQHAGDLGLPEAAKDNPEGYLYPSTYAVTGDTTPLALLQQMVSESGKAMESGGVDDAATAFAQTPYGILTVASLVEGEADNAEDMAKVARVIYNRLARNMPLQLDSSINYALGRSSLTTTDTDTKLDSPFNTYLHPGLPPTPISNPGREALRAAADPAEGDWLYFVTVRPGDTRFTDSFEQQQKNVAEFNAYQAQQSSPPPEDGH
ncbi:endolytic transglycosylase MltG [Kitasatospora sp. DSM 101779]|uniref:endolytic transglycosylase MltG n=1 Tax=Kitasatospora sp. DSM 101779 TaxID=2853165 RepID=UPI0021DA058E|nr:endolytic transglycosylase MltG [Kitasatospora sp. DSM 101779]MCU7821481.1 endolytic transglycosylase MltG [Kitasatospora sp. DSM 101779]